MKRPVGRSRMAVVRQKKLKFEKRPKWPGLLFGLALTCAVLSSTALLSACLPGKNEASSTPPGGTAVPGSELLRDLGPAPELTNEVWLNTNHPLRLESLRGKVVLLDMWTYG